MTRPDRDEILAQPISSIVDGWVLNDGQLYLFVKIDEKQHTICIPRSANVERTGQ